MDEKFGVTPEERHRMIAETAYFLAQARGFEGGDPVTDWLEAERRVERQLCELAAARMVERLRSGVATATKRLGALKRRVSSLTADARTDRRSDVERLSALKEVMREKIRELSRRGEVASAQALSQADKVWAEVGEVVQRLSARIQH